MAEGSYRTIVADPPWRYADDRWAITQGPQKGTRISTPYPTLSVSEIAQLNVSAFADPIGCHLYLWVTSHHLQAGFAVLDGWGFDYVQTLAWCKPAMGLGLGGVFVQTTEYVLFARRGKSDHQRREPASWWVWPRGRHSTKPDRFSIVNLPIGRFTADFAATLAFYDMVESVSPGPRLELFARRRRLGWHAWGDEIDSDVELVA